jgi:hypothetical protein
MNKIRLVNYLINSIIGSMDIGVEIDIDIIGIKIEIEVYIGILIENSDLILMIMKIGEIEFS